MLPFGNGNADRGRRLMIAVVRTFAPLRGPYRTTAADHSRTEPRR